jgi:hypothetical protein
LQYERPVGCSALAAGVAGIAGRCAPAAASTTTRRRHCANARPPTAGDTQRATRATRRSQSAIIGGYLPGDPLMFNSSMTIAEFDPELAKAIADERTRQEDHIELIASENYTSPRVLEAQGSVLTNKYAEGYPGKRYYGGCEFVDVAEQLAIDRAKQLFGAAYANVQPH